MAAMLIGGAVNAQTLLYEGFDSFAGALSNGWSQVNNSNPQGPTMWEQGSGTIGVATGHSGDSTSYISDTYTATSEVGSGSGNISDWVISPEVTVENGDSITLWTISFNSASFPDRLEVRMSATGGSSVGGDDASVGDFSTLVFAINPTLTTTDYPSVQINGDTWTRYGGEVSGLSGATSVRFAVRYFVTDGGFDGANGSSVGVDDIDVFHNSSTASVGELAIANVSFGPNPATDRVNIRATNGTYDMTVYNVAGARIAAERFTNNTTFSVSGLDAGVYTFELRDVRTGAVGRERVVKQ
jgi:hypothetical protein